MSDRLNRSHPKEIPKIAINAPMEKDQSQIKEYRNANQTETSSSTTNDSRSNMNVIKEPNTPSMSKSSSFSSPAPVPMPETPDRVPRHMTDLDSTPLLSPPQSSMGNLLSTPHRRKNSSTNANTDFYSLLKSPEASRAEDRSLKRRSVELFSITNAKSPEQVHREYDNEHLLKSPRRDYKEIRKISENLRTRLNYANVKVQHGWSKKSIGELEHSLEEIASNPQRSEELNSAKNLENFWHLRADNLPKNNDVNGMNTAGNEKDHPGLSSLLLSSPGFSSHANTSKRRSSFISNIRLDEVAKRGFKSPETKSTGEFLQPQAQPGIGSNAPSASVSSGSKSSPRKADSGGLKLAVKTENNESSNTQRPTNHKKSSSDSKLEQDAIISLISLSSPVKYSAGSSLSPSPPHIGSPTKSSQGKLPSLRGISNKRLPPLPSKLPNTLPLTAPGVPSGDHGGENTLNRYVLPSPPQFDNQRFAMTHPISNSSYNAPIGLGMGIVVKPNTETSINRTPSSNSSIGNSRLQPAFTQGEETDDESTEDEMIEDDEIVITDRIIPMMSKHSNDNSNTHKFRTTSFDGVKRKMTSKKSGG